MAVKSDTPSWTSSLADYRTVRKVSIERVPQAHTTVVRVDAIKLDGGGDEVTSDTAN